MKSTETWLAMATTTITYSDDFASLCLTTLNMLNTL